MVAEVQKERGALPLLAFAASRLWEKRDREKGLLTREAYREIGGVAGALAQHAEATLEQIGAQRTPIVRELFRNLVTVVGTRAVREREELLSVFGPAAGADAGAGPTLAGAGAPSARKGAPAGSGDRSSRLTTTMPASAVQRASVEAAQEAAGPSGSSKPGAGAALREDGGRSEVRPGTRAQAEDVLNALIGARLLTSYERADEAGESRQQVEIIHESLLSAWPRLVRWQTQDADGAQLRDQLRQAAQLWHDRGQTDDLVWSGTAFQDFALWRLRLLQHRQQRPLPEPRLRPVRRGPRDEPGPLRPGRLDDRGPPHAAPRRASRKRAPAFLRD
jgi:hypothetical protein